MTDLPTSLGQRLVLARRETGMQQDQVAREARISQQSYSDLETGKSKSTVRIGSLSRVLGVDAYWLETGLGKMHAGEERATYVSTEQRRLLELLGDMPEAKRKALLILLDD